jgi:quercetin dioxygenase-like cupin family protein
MALSAASADASYRFDDRNVKWGKLGDFEHFVFAMLDLNPKKGLADFIIKFDPNQQIVLHRHSAHTNTLVVQGEHRIYEPNGALKEIRPVGSYTSSPPGEPHREGGGAEGCVVYYSIRAEGDGVFEIFDDDQNLIGTLGMSDFLNLFDATKET